MPEKDNGEQQPQSQAQQRRARFERGKPRFGLTPPKLRLLAYIAECGLLTTRQCARIAGIGPKPAYNWLRDLFDAGLTQRTVVPYAALAPDGGATAYNGTLPSELIHFPSKAGLDLLRKWDMLGSGGDDETADKRKAPRFGPDNYLFVAHEVLVRDVRVWLQQCSRVDEGGSGCEWWVAGEEAHIAPIVEPDALFIYRLPGEPARRRVGLVEADRGTERRAVWERKAEQYAALLASDRLAEVARGRRNGKIVVVARTASRRDWIADVLASYPVAGSSYVACREDLIEGGIGRMVWRVPGNGEMKPFVLSGN